MKHIKILRGDKNKVDTEADELLKSGWVLVGPAQYHNNIFILTLIRKEKFQEK